MTNAAKKREGNVMYCKRCGNVISDSAVVCPSCGSMPADTALAGEDTVSAGDWLLTLFLAGIPPVMNTGS